MLWRIEIKKTPILFTVMLFSILIFPVKVFSYDTAEGGHTQGWFKFATIPGSGYKPEPTVRYVFR